jgi:hypothetical protein
MHSEMSAQVGHLHKLTIAVCTLVWLLSRVEPHVCLQVVVAGEPLLAHPAAERLLSSVSPLVVLQHVFVPEGAVTCATGEDLVTAYRHVHGTASGLRCFTGRRRTCSKGARVVKQRHDVPIDTGKRPLELRQPAHVVKQRHDVPIDTGKRPLELRQPANVVKQRHDVPIDTGKRALELRQPAHVVKQRHDVPIDTGKRALELRQPAQTAPECLDAWTTRSDRKRK